MKIIQNWAIQTRGFFHPMCIGDPQIQTLKLVVAYESL